MAVTSALRRTPLHACHAELGARFVEFAGWEMPVQYSGVIDEHLAVRNRAGLFDVSHMGEIRLRGRAAQQALESLTPNRVASLSSGRAQYSALLSEQGTYLDDLLVYCHGEEGYVLVVNAVNTRSNLTWIHERVDGEVAVTDESAETALLALQGPASLEILAAACDADLAGLRSYRFLVAEVGGVEATVSRTGYTGEDGFEIYVPAEKAASVWRQLLAAGRPRGLLPAGLGARDTLRLEASLALYGHEIDRTVTPFDVGLGWVVKLDGPDFVGRAALLEVRERGPKHALVGLTLEGRRIARQGAPVLLGDRIVGAVTSGTFSPTLQRPIALARVDREAAESGDDLTVEIRRHREPAARCELPFYRRASN